MKVTGNSPSPWGEGRGEGERGGPFQTNLGKHNMRCFKFHLDLVGFGLIRSDWRGVVHTPQSTFSLVLWPIQNVFLFFSALFRSLPRFPARRAILAGDRELEEAGRSPLGRARRAERYRFMGATIYQCYTFCQGKKCQLLRQC